MENSLIDSQRRSQRHKDQRDFARSERNVALEERDSARTERDSSISQTDTLEKNKILQEQFIATLSHDLRNPIGAIKMAIELLRGDPDTTLEKEMIDLIDRNADQANELITQLLDTHLIKSGAKLPLKKEHYNLLLVLQKCYHSLAPQQKIKIDLKFDSSEIWGFWDIQALERAFKNIINNALKFTDHNKNIQIIISQSPDNTIISFLNFGNVISQKKLTSIFDGHLRVPQDVNAKMGWGLGLTLVKGVVEAHHGKVYATSSESEGTVFTIDLPNDSRLMAH